MSVARLESGDVHVSGQIAGDLAGQSQVHISGATTGYIAVAADGSFDATLTANGFGQITARATDPLGTISVPAEVDFQDSTPIVNEASLAARPYDPTASGLKASRNTGDDTSNAPPVILSYSAQNQGGTWALSGFVLDEYAPGLTVTFHSSISTINNRTATVGSNGWFSIAFTLPQGSLGGMVSATTVDWYGEQSNQPFVYVG